MARYTTRTHAQLQAQLMGQLEREAEKLMKQMLSEFSSTLANESQRVLKDSLGSLSNGEGLNAEGFTKILSTAMRYALSKPTMQTSTSESARSVGADSAFRLSRTQAAAEATSTLSLGQRNT